MLLQMDLLCGLRRMLYSWSCRLLTELLHDEQDLPAKPVQPANRPWTIYSTTSQIPSV